ncbi:MAG: DUF2797 domain-containing protein [Gemmatimonadales bacterium]|nr:DUF2797 domain-containing protein [Gemmatimonadales bacterium]
MQTIWVGTLRKMRSTGNNPVSYFLADGWWEPENRVEDHGLNQYLGRELVLRFAGKIHCTACGRKTKKAFNQGFCFPCSQSRAEADICMIKPELCHHGEPDNPCRDESFAQAQCFQPHILYCSLTSAVKVGITREPNIPSRWIDQGATAAIPLARVIDRRSVGLLETRLVAEGFQDKTHWTRMLKGNAEESGKREGLVTGVDPAAGANLAEAADRILVRLQQWGVNGILPESDRVVHRFSYPVQVWPEKVKSFNLDKESEVGGLLQGIKGQYLIFDSGVINLRKFSGYQVDLAVAPS